MKARLQMMLPLVVTSIVANILAQEVSIPDPGLNAAIRETLAKPTGPLTAQDLLSLTNLFASSRGVSSLEGLGEAHNLTFLGLRGNQLTDLTLPAGLTNLTFVRLGYNALTNFVLPADLTSLSILELNDNSLTSFALPAGLTNLTSLSLGENQLTNLTLPAGLTSLTYLNLSGNHLTNFTLPASLTNLTSLSLGGNQLTNLTLPAGLTKLDQLVLEGNQLTDFSFLSGLTSLTSLYLQGNQLTNLTLPGSLRNLTRLYLGDNPLLKTFVLSEPLAVTGMAAEVASLRGQGVSVYAYPLAVSLVSAQRTSAGAFEFTLIGPPGAYIIQNSTNLAGWSSLGALTNQLGSAIFADPTANDSAHKFYRAQPVP